MSANIAIRARSQAMRTWPTWNDDARLSASDTRPTYTRRATPAKTTACG
jgi:hypothetical protein